MADEAETVTEAAPEAPAPAPETEASAKGSERAPDGKFAKKAEAPIEQADWRAGLPDDLRKAADKFNSPVEALKAYKQAEARISRSIVKPGKDATDEEKTAWQASLRREMGIPESLDDYKVDIPKALAEDEQTMEGIRSLLGEFHKLGVPPAAASYAIGVYEQLKAEEQRAMTEEAKEAFRDSQMELQREWGRDYDANVAIAGKAIANFADDAFVELQKMTGKELAEVVGNKRLGDLAPITRMMAKVGRATGESQTVYQQTGEAAGLIEEAERITREKDYWLDPAKQKRVSDIYGNVYGRGQA